jgi:hypothetical protein
MIFSKYIKQGDLGVGQLWTIAKIELATFGEGDKQESKWICYFNEIAKGLSLNKTNIQRLEKACGSDNSDDWIGKQVVVFWDDTVEYMGEVSGGVRIRAPKSKEEQQLPF